MDSISQLYAEKQLVIDIGEPCRDPTKLLLSDFCKRIEAPLRINGCIIIMIVHLIANTSGYGSLFSETGGNKIQYAADIKIRCKSVEGWNIGAKDNNQIGQIIKWEVGTTALNVPPGRTFKNYLRYGYGLDEVAELVDLAMDFGIFTKKGAWYRSDLFPEVTLQGQEKVIDFIRENKDAYNKIWESIKSIVL